MNEKEVKIPCEIYTRVVGYFRPVSQFNKGAKAMFDDRKFITKETVRDAAQS